MKVCTMKQALFSAVLDVQSLGRLNLWLNKKQLGERLAAYHRSVGNRLNM